MSCEKANLKMLSGVSYRRRGRSGSKVKERESGATLGDMEEDEERSERRGGVRVQKEVYRAGAAKTMAGEVRERGVVRRLQRREEEEVVRSVTVRQRRLVGRTSDYSSQSDTEAMDEPKTPVNQPARVEARRDSPRLRAFDGDDWIYSPRTGYTYAESLTYRDTATPGREVPMPHMTRLPLHDHSHDYSQVEAETTELWEKSVLESRRLAEFSEDEFSPSPPHKIFRRGGWGIATSPGPPLPQPPATSTPSCACSSSPSPPSSTGPSWCSGCSCTTSPPSPTASTSPSSSSPRRPKTATAP